MSCPGQPVPVTDNSLKPVARFADLQSLRVTQIASLRKCPRLWALQLFGVIPRVDTPASRIGTAVHLMQNQETLFGIGSGGRCGWS